MQWVEIVFSNQKLTSLKLTNLKFNLQNSAVQGKYSQQMEQNALNAQTIQELRITTLNVAQTNAHRVKSWIKMEPV